MKVNAQTMTIGNLAKLVVDQEWDFNHPIQRADEQWNDNQKSKLIDSLFRGFPIDSPRVVTTMVDDEGKLILEHGRPKMFNIVVDGKQRTLGAIAGFYQDAYELTRVVLNCPTAFTVRGEAVTLDKIAGVKYSELPQVYKSRLDETNITILYLEEVSEWELRELFRRQNGGKSLTRAQMNSAKITKKVYKDLQKISSANRDHVEPYTITSRAGKIIERVVKVDNFWHRFLGAALFRSGESRNVILSTMMFISNYRHEPGKDYDFSLKNDDIEAFLGWYDKQTDEFRASIVDKTINAAQYANTYIKARVQDENGKWVAVKRPSIKRTTIPMFIAGMDIALELGTEENYMKECTEFFRTYDENETYRALVADATATKEKINQRMNVFTNLAFK